MPENRRLFPRLTVDDNLKMGAYMPGARAKYAERLEFVFDLFPRMKERRSQMAGTMSGGEQQMCAIGRALMSDPKLLLLDEPSAGLAPVVVQQVFELVKRIRASGLTVLIVEQNVQQVLKVVDRAYLLEAGTIRASGTSAEMMSDRHDQAGVSRGMSMIRKSGTGFPTRSCSKRGRDAGFLDIFDIYLLEAVVNGILLGGVLALLALGLNLIFGVIDVTWICYAELVMIGMYGMYYMVQVFGLPYWVAAPFAILLVAALGAALHYIVIAPLLTAPPINQLLATGGVLFILQSFATVAFGIDFRNLGIRLPVLAFGEMHFSYSRLLSFAAALIGMVAIYLFMTRTYTGTAIRAIAQDRQIMSLMGVDTKRIYLITSALGGALAGLAACLLVLQYDVHPFVGLSFGPITFLICVLGGLGNFIGGFIAAFVFAADHLAGRPVLRPRMGLRAGVRLLHRHDVHPARGPVGEALVNSRHAAWAVGLAALIALPFVYRDPYHLHILVLILIWSFAYTSWSIMGRFGLVSLGHGGFMGVGAYVTALLWNHLGVSPWIGIPVSMVAAGVLALVVAYPCFRFRITGHYFVLVTLALSGIVLQVITATRDYTGGSLGYTPNRTKRQASCWRCSSTTRRRGI